MGIFTLSFPEKLLEEINKEIKIDNFVETGTYLGDSVCLVAKLIDNVYTIKLSQKYLK